MSYSEIRAAIAKAREDPHTDWVMTFVDWIGWPLLLVCLAPCIWLAWKSQNFRSLARSIRWGWAGWFIWHVLMGGVAPYLVIEWTGEDILAEAFPSMGILPMALFGWLPGAIVSFVICSFGIMSHSLRGLNQARPQS